MKLTDLRQGEWVETSLGVGRVEKVDVEKGTCEVCIVRPRGTGIKTFKPDQVSGKAENPDG